FSIRGAEGADSDVAAMYEVISRRFTRYLEESQRVGELDTLGESGAPQGAERKAPRFAYPPNLVVVDGGRPQVAAAQRALDDLGIEDVAVCGLAKRLEEVWLPGEEGPIILPRTSEGLYLLQRVRDEAHRFAISYHRRKRAKALTASVLDDIPGLGPVRRAALLKHFGSVRRLAQATAAEIAEVPGIGERTAQTIYERLTSVEGGQRTQPENSKADE
ncbi:MAG UNVERIFIED_CONTAM: excinuclease ABC subunit C, partial [Thermobifida fusca]